MNDKITFPRLAGMLADISGRSKRFSEDFLREFFALISETLEAGESVKVKGLGTFRLSRVEPRKSVDVTTGEPMEISGHSKVVFIPSKELAAAVNAPFEAFSAIEIDDDTDLSQIFSKDEIELQNQTYDAEEETAGEIARTEEGSAIEPETEEYPEVMEASTPDEPESTETQDDTESIDISEITEISDGSEDTVNLHDSNSAGDFGYATKTVQEVVEEESGEETTASEDEGDGHNTEEDDSEGDEDIEGGLVRKRNWKRAILITLGVAVLALIVTIAVWYMYAGNDFNSIFNRNVTTSLHPSMKTDRLRQDSISDAEKVADTSQTKETTDDIQAGATAITEAEVPTAPSDQLVYDTISTTRYLTTMARAHYGNFNLWPFIYEENKAILGHPDRIRPGTPVVIPKLSKYGVDASNKADIEKAKKMGVEIYARFGKKI